MCLPAVAFIAAGIAASAAHKQANAENALSEYRGRVAQNNAQVAQWQAEDAKARGDLSVAQNRRKYAALQGTQEASMAAKGLDISYGSPNAILTDTDFFGAYDENIIRANSRREAWAHMQQRENFLNENQLLRDQRKANNPWVAGSMAFASSLFGSMGRGGGGGGGGQGSLMTDSGSVANRWYGGVNNSAGSGSSSTWG